MTLYEYSLKFYYLEPVIIRKVLLWLWVSYQQLNYFYIKREGKYNGREIGNGRPFCMESRPKLLLSFYNSFH